MLPPALLHGRHKSLRLLAEIQRKEPGFSLIRRSVRHAAASKGPKVVTKLELDPERSASTAVLSTTQRGTAFEERTLRLLCNLSMSLRRVGGKGDEGVDLLGWWWLPLPDFSSSSQLPQSAPPSSAHIGGDFSSGNISDAQFHDPGTTTNNALTDARGVPRARVRVIAQCKAEKRKLGPGYVREMEGVVHRHLHVPFLSGSGALDLDREPTVGVLVSESSFSPASLVRAMSSQLPLLLLHLPPLARPSEKEPFRGTDTLRGLSEELKAPNSFTSAFWNRALSAHVLSGRADLRWELSSSREDFSTTSGRGLLSLWCGGKRLEGWMPASERLP